MAPITPTEQDIAVAVQNAARIGPTLGPLITRYTCNFLPNDPETSRALMEAGMAILPGIRLDDAAEAAMWAYQAHPVVFEGFVIRAYQEGRVYRRVSLA